MKSRHRIKQIKNWLTERAPTVIVNAEPASRGRVSVEVLQGSARGAPLLTVLSMTWKEALHR